MRKTLIGTVREVAEGRWESWFVIQDLINLSDGILDLPVYSNPKLRSRAGKYFYGSRIEIHPDVWRDEAKAFQTFGHELAHAIDWYIRKETDHGPEWKAVMVGRLGLPPERTHRYGLVTSEKLKVVGVCEGCGEKIERRRSLPKRGTYRHTACGANIARYDEGIEELFPNRRK